VTRKSRQVGSEDPERLQGASRPPLTPLESRSTREATIEAERQSAPRLRSVWGVGSTKSASHRASSAEACPTTKEHPANLVDSSWPTSEVKAAISEDSQAESVNLNMGSATRKLSPPPHGRSPRVRQRHCQRTLFSAGRIIGAQRSSACCIYGDGCHRESDVLAAVFGTNLSP
jgi:hypothetical protein